jgi:hypothetical protein
MKQTHLHMFHLSAAGEWGYGQSTVPVNTDRGK